MSVRVIFVLLFFTVCIYASEYVLQDRYEYTDAEIYSNDLVKNPPINFQVLQIPSNHNVYKVHSDEVVLAFAKRGMEVVPPSSSTITFMKKVEFDKKRLQEHISKVLEKEYGRFDVDIKHIEVEPTSGLSLKGYGIDEIGFDAQEAKKSSGSFRVDFIDSSGRKKAIYFRYTIQATILGYVASKDIKGNEAISLKDFTQKRVSLDMVRREPASKNDLKKVYSKNYIPEGNLITKNSIKKLPDIKRGDRVVISDSKGAILIQSIGEALENGSIGDVVRVRLKNNKVANGIVTGKNRVDLR